MNYVVISIVNLISCLQNTDCKCADGVPGDVCMCVCVRACARARACVRPEPQFSFPCNYDTAVTWRSVGEERCMHWES